MIEVITGPMYSGKTEELIRRLTRATIAQRKVVALKPRIDTRHPETVLSSHSGIKIDCWSVDTDLLDMLTFPMAYNLVGIDEAQFFDANVVKFVQFLSSRGIKVVIAGLDMTYRREPFGCMPYLMAIARDVTKLSAVCHVCGDDAHYTQRLINGRPAPYSGETILVGALDSYEARCWYCYEEG
jgi:thymidine kinase